MVMELDRRTGTPRNMAVGGSPVEEARRLLALATDFIGGQGKEVAVHWHPDGRIEIDHNGPGWVVTHRATRGDCAMLFKREREARAEAAVRAALGGPVRIIALPSDAKAKL